MHSKYNSEMKARDQLHMINKVNITKILSVLTRKLTKQTIAKCLYN